jgi:hypothetical protein
VALQPRTPDHFLYETLLPHPRSRLCREVSGPADGLAGASAPHQGHQGSHSARYPKLRVINLAWIGAVEA